MPNPYLNRSMIRSLDGFYGRRREVERLMARLSAPSPQSVSVVGQRRAGKSSLLWRLAQPEVRVRHLSRPEQYLFLLLDFQGQQHLDPEGFCRLFCQQLAALAADRVVLAQAAGLAGLEQQIQALGRAGLRLVFLADEFEALTRSPSFGAEFFGFLRSLANGHPVAFITASHRGLQELCHARQIAESPFFNIFSQVHLGPMLPDEVRELIAVPSAAAGLPLEPHAGGLAALGGRLPFFLQLACSALFECLLEAPGQEPDWEAVEQRFLDEAGPHFRYLWDHLDAAQQIVVGGLAAGVPPAAENTAALTTLEMDGYVDREAGRFRVFSRSLARFVRELPPGTVPASATERPPARSPDRPRPAATAQVEPVPPGASPFPRIVGQSPAIRRVFALMQRAIAAEVTVLLLGETGTGKELVARVIHQHSRRREGLFVVVNCGAIPEHLQESELFGHRRGSFTGAVADREGLFEAAHQGTLFLDEISELSPAAQVKLLRALQDGEIRRVGENHIRRVDLRLICATNRELEEEVAQGRFREDLYYRLYVLALRLPPLRERREDIPLLVAHFLADYPFGVGPQVLDLFCGYSWPGNIRELENQLAGARAMAGDGCIETAHLWPRLQQARPAGAAAPGELGLKEAREDFEREFIQGRLQALGWDLDAVARSLDLSRSRLYELVRKFGLKEE